MFDTEIDLLGFRSTRVMGVYHLHIRTGKISLSLASADFARVCTKDLSQLGVIFPRSLYRVTLSTSMRIIRGTTRASLLARSMNQLIRDWWP